MSTPLAPIPRSIATSASTALRLTGRDVLVLLHRISTNALDDLAVGQARVTLFCDFRGRLLHRAVTARASDDAVWLLRDDAPGEALAAFIERHVFREEVRIEDRSPVLSVRGVAAGGPAPGTMREQEGEPVAVQIDPRFGYALAAGQPVEPMAEIARVEAGRVRHGHEIVDEFTPYEVGLSHEVHLNKGCYTGQEALARLVTYGSIRRRLARVEGRSTVPVPPLDVRRGADMIGRLTSAVAAPLAEAPERWIGLAVLKHEAFGPEDPLMLEDGVEISRVFPVPLTQPLGRS